MDSSNSDVVARVFGTARVVLKYVTLSERRLILEAAIKQCKPLKYFGGFKPLRQIISESGLYPSERISIEPQYQVTGDTKLFILAEVLPRREEGCKVCHLALDQDGALYTLVWGVDPELGEPRCLREAKNLSITLLNESSLEALLEDPCTVYRSLAILLEAAEGDMRRRRSHFERSDEIFRTLKGVWDRCSTSP